MEYNIVRSLTLVQVTGSPGVTSSQTATRATVSQTVSPLSLPTPTLTASLSHTPSSAPSRPPAASNAGDSAALGVGLGVGIPLSILVLGGAALWVASARSGVPAPTLLARTFGMGGRRGGFEGVGKGGRVGSSSLSSARAAQLAASSGSSYQGAASSGASSDRASLLSGKGSYGGIGGGV